MERSRIAPPRLDATANTQPSWRQQYICRQARIDRSRTLGPARLPRPEAFSVNRMYKLRMGDPRTLTGGPTSWSRICRENRPPHIAWHPKRRRWCEWFGIAGIPMRSMNVPAHNPALPLYGFAQQPAPHECLTMGRARLGGDPATSRVTRADQCRQWRAASPAVARPSPPMPQLRTGSILEGACVGGVMPSAACVSGWTSTEALKNRSAVRNATSAAKSTSVAIMAHQDADRYRASIDRRPPKA